MATAVIPTHMAAVSTSANPLAAMPAVMVMARTTFTATMTMTAAAVRACRPTTEDNTSSADPFSSSARVWRITVRIAKIEVATISVSISSLAIITPRSVSWPPNMGPPSMIPAGVLSRLTRA